MSVTVERDRWDRPLIIPPGGGAPVPYQRASSYGDVLDDTYNLRKWEQRHVALGLADRPDLLNLVAANRLPESDPKDERDRKGVLNRLCDEAKEQAGVSRSSNTGTALHKLTERVDRGEQLPTMPGTLDRDIEAFTTATMMLQPVDIERFLVNDYLGVAGTTDRLYRIANNPHLTVGDTKTGQGLKFGIVKIAVQLSIYSRSVGYDPATGERTDLDIDQDWGVIVHLPAGTGTCELIWINLQKGWSLALTAQDVRDSRKLKYENLTKPVDIEELIG